MSHSIPDVCPFVSIIRLFVRSSVCVLDGVWHHRPIRVLCCSRTGSMPASQPTVHAYRMLCVCKTSV